VAFTPQEKEKIRYHSGYLNAQPAASIQLGVPRPVQTLFLIEDAMDRLLPNGSEDRVRKIICILDGIEDRMIAAQGRLAVKKVEEIEMRPDEPDALEEEYTRWAQRMVDIFGVPLYPLSPRFANAGGVKAGSIPVRR
jgi:hypothetical protein